jgi:hypothetical protein
VANGRYLYCGLFATDYHGYTRILTASGNLKGNKHGLAPHSSPPELSHFQATQLAANILPRLGYVPIWQDIFGTEAGDLRQMLRDKIDDCEALLHLVGFAYGYEPPTPDPEFGRCYYNVGLMRASCSLSNCNIRFIG